MNCRPLSWLSERVPVRDLTRVTSAVLMSGAVKGQASVIALTNYVHVLIASCSLLLEAGAALVTIGGFEAPGPSISGSDEHLQYCSCRLFVHR